jgi:hypothetical protein
MKSILLFILGMCVYNIGAKCHKSCCGQGSITESNFVGTNDNNESISFPMIFFKGTSGGSVDALYDSSLDGYLGINVKLAGNITLDLQGEVGATCENTTLNVIDKVTNHTLLVTNINQGWSTQNLSISTCYQSKEVATLNVIIIIPGHCKVYTQDLDLYVTEETC